MYRYRYICNLVIVIFIRFNQYLVMIKVLYSAETLWSDELHQQNLQLLPLLIQQKITLYKDKKVQQQRINARLMLLHLFKEIAPGNPHSLDDIKYNRFNKGYIDDSLYFSTSYTKGLTICAVSVKNWVGIDAEKILSLDTSLFKDYFTEKEWGILQANGFDLMLFYSFWTRKEAALKAIGRGIYEDLNKIDIIDDNLYYKGHTWYVQNISLQDAYSISLVSLQREEVSLQLFY